MSRSDAFASPDEEPVLTSLPPGVLRLERTSYRGKHYEVPVFDATEPVLLDVSPAWPAGVPLPTKSASPVLADLDSVWDRERFLVARRPVSLGCLSADELVRFAKPGAVRVLDLPVKMPDDPVVRLPRALAAFAEVVARIVAADLLVSPRPLDYYAYLTIDQRWVAPGTLHREAPCHVDGFQGARWQPKCRINHSYTVSDVLPTAYYEQPFDLRALDETKHDFFWEMNAQVADTNEAHRYQPAPAEITLMDAYSVHRGVENDGTVPVFRTWLRLSFEERRRRFDRLGNAHNPLFDYDWPMVDRDIEQLGLVAYRPSSDASLRVFPWQDLNGAPLPPGAHKTKPRLRSRT
jgi:hypothetical protein